jgi:mRNA interferase MazF
MRRGEVWWADLPDAVGSAPGLRRPVLIVSSDQFNASALQTVLCVALTTNVRLAHAPGNVALQAGDAGLRKASVVNVSQLLTLDKSFLDEPIGALATATLARVDAGLRLVLSLA